MLIRDIDNFDNWTQIRDILKRDVTVAIDPMAGTDSVSIAGYAGTLSTDHLADLVYQRTVTGFVHFFGGAMFLNYWSKDPEIALEVAGLLKSKVFIPLRERLVDLEKSGCCSSLLYKINNTTYRCFNVQKVQEVYPDRRGSGKELSGGYWVLSHSYCAIALEQKALKLK